MHQGALLLWNPLFLKCEVRRCFKAVDVCVWRLRMGSVVCNTICVPLSVDAIIKTSNPFFPRCYVRLLLGDDFCSALHLALYLLLSPPSALSSFPIF